MSNVVKVIEILFQLATSPAFQQAIKDLLACFQQGATLDQIQQQHPQG